MEKNLAGKLPINNNLTRVVKLSLVIAVLMTTISALGLLIPDLFYPDPDLAQTFLTNDLVNIILGLPLFLIALISLNRGKVLGLLLMPGFFVYVVYNYIAYALGRPLSGLTILNAALVVLGSFSLVIFLKAIDQRYIKLMLEGCVAEKITGWILVFFGVAFIALAISQIVTGIREGLIPPLGEQAVSVADIVVSAGWVSGGVLLLRRKPMGYALGLGLLIAASFLFIGLILFFFLAPFLVGRPFDWVEVITVLVMGFISFIPTGLYWRGVLNSVKAPSE